jgi:hypothetical protein
LETDLRTVPLFRLGGRVQHELDNLRNEYI